MIVRGENGPSPRAAVVVRDLRVDLLCPFDLDFEPDVERLAEDDVSVLRVQPGPGGAPAVEIPRAMMGAVSFKGEILAGEAAVAARVYRFGTGIVRVSFTRDAWDMATMALVASKAEEVKVDGKPVVEVARELGDAVRKRLRSYAIATYEAMLDAVEAYPIFRVGALPEGASGEDFLDAERRSLAAIVGGMRTGKLSEFAIEAYPVTNVGALAEDVVAIRESGAFVHTCAAARGADGDGAAEALADARRIEGLIELSYAQYWALRSVDHLIQHLQDEAYEFISRVQRSGATVPLADVLSRLYRAREEHMAVSNVVDDFLELPAIGYDIYLDALFRKVQETFGVLERSRLARDRLEDLEQSYEVVHQITSERRLFTIEVLVLVVIVLELLLAWFHK